MTTRNRALIALSILVLAAPALGQSGKPNDKLQPPTDPFKDPPKERGRRDTPPETGEKAKVDLRPRFEKGQVIRFKMDLDQRSSSLVQALDDKPTETTSNQELSLVFKVKEAGDEGSVIEMTFSRVKMSKVTDEGKEEFDSNQPPAKDNSTSIGASLRALAKTTFTLHLDRDGNLTNIEGGDSLMSLDAFGVQPGAFNPGGLPGGTPTPPQGGPTGNGFKNALGSIFSIKKGSQVVSVGEEWSNSDQLDTGLLGKFKITDKHKLRSHRDGEARVSVNGAIEPDTQGGEGFSLVKIRDCTFVGDYLWNTREGMLRRMNIHQHVVLEASAGGGITVTSDMKTVVTRN